MDSPPQRAQESKETAANDPTIRRQFLRLCAQLGESYAILLGTLGYLAWSRYSKSQFTKEDFGYDEQARLQLVNKTHQLPQGGRLRNIGVLHNKEFFDRHQNFFHTAIQDSDVVFLEGSNDEFFAPCLAHAHEHRKRVVMIDDVDKGLVGIGKLGLAGAGMIMTGEAAWNYWKNVPETLLSRRNFFRGSVGMFLGELFLSGDHRDPGQPIETNDSYVARGRSAAQWKEEQNVINSNPTLRYLSITGNTHADFFEHYRNHPEECDRDLERFWFQYAIYGRGQKEMTAK